MCDPAILGGMALSAGGSYLNAQEAGKNESRMAAARKDASEAERIRQQKYQEQTAPLFTGELDRQSLPQQDAALLVAKGKRENTAREAVADAGEYNITSGSAPDAVRSNLAKVVEDAVGKSRDQAGAGGRLAAWGDVGQANRFGINNTAGRVGTINDFSRGSLNLLPMEQEVAARNAYKPPSGIGDILQLAGTGLNLGGSMGWFNNPSIAGLANVRNGGIIPQPRPPVSF